MNTRIFAALVFVVIVVGGVLVARTPANPPIETAQKLEVSLAIDGVLPLDRTEVLEGTTALELLRDESAREGFVLVTKEYAGLGTLVEQIGSSVNGTDGNYWTYTVNDVFVPIGADAYVLKSGDQIEWSFAVPEDI